jgi:hypothetical protein
MKNKHELAKKTKGFDRTEALAIQNSKFVEIGKLAKPNR